ncbi:uncharacterized protein [Amphiura filiformis]|uniref:uncharacterized protein n=1 Tax=Amphiura filiformis TaxID=82378 RepID=UPI003B20C141
MGNSPSASRRHNSTRKKEKKVTQNVEQRRDDPEKIKKDEENVSNAQAVDNNVSKTEPQKSTDKQPSFQLLPELVLVHIFSFLTVSEKCVVAGLCRAWNAAVRDKQIWKSFTFAYNKSKFNKRLSRYIPSSVPDFFTAYIGEHLITCTYDNIPESVIMHLKKYCPNLKSLSITNYTGCYRTCSTNHRRINKGCVSAIEIDLSNLPSSLEELQLKLDVASITSRSSIAFDTSERFFMLFENLSDNKFPKLKKLTLCEATIGDGELALLSKFTNLAYLHLESGIFSVSDVAIRMSALLQALSELTHLEFLTSPRNDFKYEDLANVIKEHAKKLTHLKISCPQFSVFPLDDYKPALYILATIPTLHTFAVCVNHNVGIFNVLQNICDVLPQNCHLILNVCRGYPTTYDTDILKAVELYRPDLQIAYLDVYWKEFASLPVDQKVVGLRLVF